MSEKSWYPHVVHLSSAHKRNDIRIFLKEARSLASAGYCVSLVVADGQSNQCVDGVEVISVANSKGKIDRIFNSVRRVYSKAKEVDGDIYHLHDPELLPVGLKLKKLGKKVIFDAHEDTPKQLLTKPYLTPGVLKILSWVFYLFEKFSVKRMDGVIAATPAIRNKFVEINERTVDINNYPMQGELESEKDDWSSKRNWISYVGGITSIRGIEESIQAIENTPDSVRLCLAGQFTSSELEKRCSQLPGWKKVDFLGYLDREAVKQLLSGSLAGLVTFHPVPNHVDSQPNKMFEYMSAGIPVIASRFPLWQEIIEENSCGICVDPLNNKEISAAIKFLADNPAKAREMGENGRKAVELKYNWRAEEKKLLDFYNIIAEV